MQVVIERRPTLLFIVVLGLLFLLMSVSGQTRYVGETRTLFERTFMTVFSPVPTFVNWIGRGTADIYHGYVDMRRAVNENVQLHRQVASLTTDNLKLRQSEGDLRRLRTLLGYSEQFSMPTTMAVPIMIDTSGRFKSILIDRGSSSDVQVNDAVVNASGLVGRVVLTTKDLAKVQLLTDGDCSVGTIVERTRRQGVVRGDGTGAQMFDVPAREDIQPGDTVMTGGIDGIYPKGILVGTVVRAEEGKGLFKMIWIRPAVDTSNLEEVIVLHTRKIPPEVVRYAP
ncbi:MAG TPA: rod shape-determining protein MreC [Thermoanaerobaculia bacterium]|nr:rod shape-determining protein MreC [Thermoanaerobaculia bacterium]